MGVHIRPIARAVYWYLSPALQSLARALGLDL